MIQERCKQGFPQDTCNLDGFKCPCSNKDEQKEMCKFYEQFKGD